MRKYLLPILLFSFWSCEEANNENTTPISVTITSPQNNSEVYELVNISCDVSDNEGFDRLELWVNGDSTGLIDDSDPYNFEWNSVLYEDETYTITIRFYDVNGNISESEPLILIVNNSNSYPQSIDITSLNFENSGFYIKWSKSDDNDFASYKLFESLSYDMSEETLVYETNDILDTSYFVFPVENNQIRYYQISSEDEFGLKSRGQVGQVYSTISFWKILEYHGGISSLHETFDSGYVLGGSRDGNMFLVKTNFSGDVVWENSYYDITPGSEYIEQFEQTLDDGYIILGNNTVQVDQNMILRKTDEYGNELWMKYFDNKFGTGLYQNTSGEIFICGHNVEDGMLMKLDQSGNEIFDITFIQSSLSSIQPTVDGGFIFGGEKNGNSYVLKTNSSGIKEWDKTYDASYGVEDIIQNSDGTSIFSYRQEDFINIMKIDASGNELWNHSYAEYGYKYGDLQKTEDGGYLLLLNYLVHDCDIYLTKINQDGVIEWDKYFGDNTACEAGGVAKQTMDGGFIIAGTTVGDDSNILLIKTDSNVMINN